MRPKGLSALSLLGVLGAGGIAAAANMRVFDGPDDGAPVGAVGATLPASAEISPSDTSRDTPSDAVGVQTFQIARAGTITLDAAGGLHLVAADPAPGWRAEQRAGAAGTVVVEFEAEGDNDVTATALLTPDGIRVGLSGDDSSEIGDDDLSPSVDGSSGPGNAEDRLGHDVDDD